MMLASILGPIWPHNLKSPLETQGSLIESIQLIRHLHVSRLCFTSRLHTNFFLARAGNVVQPIQR